jgi:hypothetical protein
MTTNPDAITASPGQELAQLHARLDLLHRHGVTAAPDAAFDAIATRLAHATGFPYAMVNLFLDRQRFAGLHNPPTDSGLPSVGRDMSIRHGWCPHVVNRKLGLPLVDVHANRLYSGNEVVDAIGISAYIGEPLIYPGTDTVLGTVCVIDQRQRPLADADHLMEIVEEAAAEVMTELLARFPRTTP